MNTLKVVSWVGAWLLVGCGGAEFTAGERAGHEVLDQDGPVRTTDTGVSHQPVEDGGQQPLAANGGSDSGTEPIDMPSAGSAGAAAEGGAGGSGNAGAPAQAGGMAGSDNQGGQPAGGSGGEPDQDEFQWPHPDDEHDACWPPEDGPGVACGGACGFYEGSVPPGYELEEECQPDTAVRAPWIGVVPEDVTPVKKTFRVPRATCVMAYASSYWWFEADPGPGQFVYECVVVAGVLEYGVPETVVTVHGFEQGWLQLVEVDCASFEPGSVQSCWE